MEQRNASELTWEVAYSESQVSISLAGAAKPPSAKNLSQFLQQVHEETVRQGLNGASVDLRDLQLMDATCFKVIVDWIEDIRKMPESAQYQVRFMSSPTRQWQKRSLKALEYFGVSVIRSDGER